MSFPWNILCSPTTRRPVLLDAGGASLMTGDEAERWPILGGIPDFVERHEPDSFGELARRERWVEQQWPYGQEAHRSGWRPALAEPLCRETGIVLEVASGPGGGFLPWTVLGGEAHIVALDVSRSILEDWKRILDGAGYGERASFVAGDARRMPLRDSSVDAVSSRGGVANIEGWDAAIAEVARVLRPGGRLYSEDGAIDPEDWARLPAGTRAEWEMSMPTLTLGLGPLLEAAGLEIVETAPGTTRLLDPEEGGMPAMAAEHGVRLRMAQNLIIARKPA